jgi:hypothetical protein
MAAFSAFQIQKAIDAVLVADSTLLALLGSGTSASIVANPVQSNPVFPYVAYGDSLSSEWSTKSKAGAETTIDLHVFSQTGDQEQCAAIMDRLHTLLHFADLTVTGNSIVFIMWDSFATIQIDDTDERITFHGIIRFKAITQAN